MIAPSACANRLVVQAQAPLSRPLVFMRLKRHAYIRAPEHTPDPEPHAPEPRPGAGPGPVQLHLRNELTRDELDDLDLFYDF